MRQVLYDYHYPTISNRYHIIKPLGSGGMAAVYLAHDEVLDRDVALKVLKHRFTDDEEFVERFRREARISAALSHPNIASVYDLGEIQNGSYYMSMEYVPGRTLRELVSKKGSLSPGKAVEIAIQVAEALSTAHACGIVHRDIKPQNILLANSQEVKVVDFGIARAAALSEITKEGHVLGTEHYMSPEQAKGEPVGPQSDLYSLGVVLYEMLTGKLPHEAYGPLLGRATVAKHLSEYPRSPKEINPLVPKKLSTIVVRLLSEEPERRYQSASSLKAELEKVKSESLGSTAAGVLRSAFEKGRTFGSITTKAFNSAAQQARMAYQRTYKSQTLKKTKPYAPSVRILRHKTHQSGKVKQAHRQQQNRPSRTLPLVLTLVAVLASLNLIDPGAKSRLLGEVERKLEYTLRGIERNIDQAIETELNAIETKVVDSVGGIFTPASADQHEPKNPSHNGEGGLPLPQNTPSSQSPSLPYNSPPTSPLYPSDTPEGSFPPGMYIPDPSTPS